MTDAPITFKCAGCGFDAPSKFALKKHKRVCQPEYRVFTNSDRYALANRETKYHRFVKG